MARWQVLAKHGELTEDGFSNSDLATIPECYDTTKGAWIPSLGAIAFHSVAVMNLIRWKLDSRTLVIANLSFSGVCANFLLF